MIGKIVYLVLLCSLAIQGQLVNYENAIKDLQFTYNQRLDYIFSNGQASKAGGQANTSFYQVVDDLMTVFCTDNFNMWGTNFPPPPYTTIPQVKAAYIGYSLNMYYNYSHHELHNYRVLGPYYQDGYFYANFTAMLVQYAKANYSSFAEPGIQYYRIEGFYNNQYRFDFRTQGWCMSTFYAYTQSIFSLPNQQDYVGAPYTLYNVLTVS